jgi:hypothetical protein
MLVATQFNFIIDLHFHQQDDDAQQGKDLKQMFP